MSKYSTHSYLHSSQEKPHSDCLSDSLFKPGLMLLCIEYLIQCVLYALLIPVISMRQRARSHLGLTSCCGESAARGGGLHNPEKNDTVFIITDDQQAEFSIMPSSSWVLTPEQD